MFQERHLLFFSGELPATSALSSSEDERQKQKQSTFAPEFTKEELADVQNMPDFRSEKQKVDRLNNEVQRVRDKFKQTGIFEVAKRFSQAGWIVNCTIGLDPERFAKGHEPATYYEDPNLVDVLKNTTDTRLFTQGKEQVELDGTHYPKTIFADHDWRYANRTLDLVQNGQNQWCYRSFRYTEDLSEVLHNAERMFSKMNRDQLNKEDNAAKFNQIWGEKESTYESIFNGQKSPFAESKVRSITENQKMVLQLIKDRPELKDTPLQVLMNGIEFQSGSNGKVYLLVKRDIAVEYRAFHELLVRGTKKVIITNGDYAYTEVVHDPAIIMDIFNELRTSLSGKKPESYELRLMELTGSPQSHEEALGRSGKGLDFLKTIHGDILSVSKTAVNILDLSLPNTQEETPQHRQKIVVFKRVSDGKFQAEGQIAIDVTELRKNADQCKQKIWSWGDESNEALWQVMNQEEQLRNSPQDNLLAKQDFREQLINAYMKALSPKERIRDAYTLLLPDNSEAQHKYEMVQRNIDFIKNRIRELSERDERERGQLYLSTIASKIEEYI